MDIILVTWVDSKMCDKSWEKGIEATHLTSETVTSVGHLLKETDQDLILAMCHAPDNVNGVLAIPKVSIKDRKTLIKI